VAHSEVVSGVRRQNTKHGWETSALLTIELDPGPPSGLHVSGEIDMSSAEQLSAAITDGLAADPNLVLDLADVTFVDLIGLRAIVEAAQSLNGHQPLRIVNAPRVAKLLALVYPSGIPSLTIQQEA
jgi:anti-anti-sigma factor